MKGSPRFICDAMCCGAAKCIRAWGYYAYWEYGINDAQVISMALKDDMVVVTGDSGILERKVVTSGRVKAVYVPVGLDRWEQFERVLKEYSLPRQEPRCMKCGGLLEMINKEDFKDELPPKTYNWLDEFYRCKDCTQFFWKGTHWTDIAENLDKIEKGLATNGHEY
jgi:uncharacterized protein with PIN domain